MNVLVALASATGQSMVVADVSCAQILICPTKYFGAWFCALVVA